MAKRRRGAQRAAAQATSVGQRVQLARASARLTRESAAKRAGIARSTFERIEAGDPGVALGTLVAATDAVGLDLVCQVYPGRDLALRDSGQLNIAQFLSVMAGPAWRVTLEEPAGNHGEAIDMVLWGPDQILAIEIERLMLDYQAQSRRAAVKRDWLAAQHRRPVRSVLVIEDTRRNRAAMAQWTALLSSARPMGSRAVLASLRSGARLGSDGICWIRRPARGEVATR